MSLPLTLAETRALENIANSIDRNRTLPDQVFRGVWSCFRLFASDALFVPSFAGVMNEFLTIEASTTVCLLNFGIAQDLDDQRAAEFFFRSLDPSEYYRRLKETKWLYDMYWYGCSSDSGEWAIYCERENEIAVIALRSGTGLRLYDSALRMLGALSISAILLDIENAPFPFHQLVDEWQAGLRNNYA